MLTGDFTPVQLLVVNLNLIINPLASKLFTQQEKTKKW